MSSSYRTVNPTGLVTDLDSREAARLMHDDKVCGMCVHFCHAEGQKRFGPDHQNLINMVVRVAGWQLYMLGSKPENLGICGQHESGANASSGAGMKITGKMHSAYENKKVNGVSVRVLCDGFRPANGRIGGGR